MPIILANASVPLLGLVDTTTIGQTGTATDLGAIALTTLVFSFVYWTFGFLRMGTTGFIAQANGKNDRDEVLAVLYRSVLLGGAIGVALVLFQYFIGSSAIWLMSAGQGVKALVKVYFYIRIWGAPATLITYAILGTLIGMGWTKQLLWVQLVLNGANVVLNVVLVWGFGMGVKGIALGTLMAEWLALAFAGYMLFKKLEIKQPVRQTQVLWSRIVDSAQWLAVFRVNSDIMIRTFALLCGFAWFANQGARFGDTTLAANHVLLQFVSMSAFFLDGFAHVAEMLSGKAIGAGDKKGFMRQLKESTFLAGITALLLGTGIVVGAPHAIGWITKELEVQQMAQQYAAYAGVYVMCSFVAFQLDGIFIGATRSKEMRNASVMSLLLLISAGMWLAPVYGNVGLWVSFVVYVIVRGVSLGIYVPKLIRELF